MFFYLFPLILFVLKLFYGHAICTVILIKTKWEIGIYLYLISVITKVRNLSYMKPQPWCSVQACSQYHSRTSHSRNLLYFSLAAFTQVEGRKCTKLISVHREHRVRIPWNLSPRYRMWLVNICWMYKHPVKFFTFLNKMSNSVD